MNMNEYPEILNEEEPAAAGEHELHMWSPLRLHIGAGYDYLGDSLFCRILYACLKPIALGVFALLNPLLLGLQIHGRENIQRLRGRGAISICNHVHPLDCTMIGTAFFDHKLYFATLQSNLEIPLIRHLVRGLGGMPIPRSFRKMPAFSDAVGEAVRRGQIVQIYPEGVLRFYYPGVRRFKNGAFAYAYDNNAPLLPSVVTYAQPTGLHRLFKRKPCLRLTVLPPVYPDVTKPKREEIARLKSVCYRRMSAFYQEHSFPPETVR